MDIWRRESLSCLFVDAFMLLAGNSYAIPAFSRQYGTSCSTCHVDFPKLNDFDKAFKDAGFKFPKDDETFIKVPPVMLGSPAQKELWPQCCIFPGTIPGMPQIGLRYNQFFQYSSWIIAPFLASLQQGVPHFNVALPATLERARPQALDA